MKTYERFSEFAGRVLIASLFVISGFGKLTAYAATQAYMAQAGVPAALLPLVILAELGGGLAIAGGLLTRWIAPLMAAFTLATAFAFHHDLQDQMQRIHFLKNLSITGAFLVLAARGAGPWSIDGLRRGA